MTALTLSTAAAERWSSERAQGWYDNQPWLVGANFVPSTAINQLEMWQEATWDPRTIDRELGYAADIGMNTMRVFLHDLAWKADPEGFLDRMDAFLGIADRHGMRIMFVFWDSVWNPNPKTGKQPDPYPHRHNSGWVQSPGRELLGEPDSYDQLKPYITSVVSRFKDDPRVVIWDLFNEPDNNNRSSYGGDSKDPDFPEEHKRELASRLLLKTFAWIREINPSQPLTTGFWSKSDWLENDDVVDKVIIANSDIISFHSYAGPKTTSMMLSKLATLGRPIVCTEYMAREVGSTFEAILPVFKEHRVGAYNWGLVSGKSQTIYPWRSWSETFTAEPDPWFHDIFRPDGTPYDPAEVELIRKLTGCTVTD